MKNYLIVITLSIILTACGNSTDSSDYASVDSYPNVTATFSGKIDLNIYSIMPVNPFLPTLDLIIPQEILLPTKELL